MATIVDNAERSRFEIHVDGELAGFTVYRQRPGIVDLVHTEIGDAFEGRGLGGQLARGALDQVRASGRQVVATCPFIKGWIAKHEDYQDLLVA